jgi:hypothetical protein
LDRHRRPEPIDGADQRRHEPVAEILDLLTPELGHRLADQAEVDLSEVLGRVVAGEGKRARRSDEIGEEQRDDPAGRWKHPRMVLTTRPLRP